MVCRVHNIYLVLLLLVHVARSVVKLLGLYIYLSTYCEIYLSKKREEPKEKLRASR